MPVGLRRGLGRALLEPIQRTVELPAGIDVRLTMSALWLGPHDPHLRFAAGTIVRAWRTADGPASLRLTLSAAQVQAAAWGAGAALALDAVPALIGLNDDAAAFEPHHRLLRELVRRHAGLRMTRTDGVFEALVPAIIAQKVSSTEARHSYFALIDRFGEPAPGPLGLRLAPSPATLAGLPYHAFHPLGIERRRAEALLGAASVADSLERLAGKSPAEARRRLATLPGIGTWTAAETVRLALGDPDAVSVGDYNLPNLVSWLLAGEPRGDDARMLELLAPYAGQRARAVRLLELSGRRPPRFGPRLARRSIAGI